MTTARCRAVHASWLLHRQTLSSCKWRRVCNHASPQSDSSLMPLQLGRLLVEAARSYPVRIPLTGALLTHLLRTRCAPLEALPFPVQEALLQGAVHQPAAVSQQGRRSWSELALQVLA